MLWLSVQVILQHTTKPEPVTQLSAQTARSFIMQLLTLAAQWLQPGRRHGMAREDQIKLLEKAIVSIEAVLIALRGNVYWEVRETYFTLCDELTFIKPDRTKDYL